MDRISSEEAINELHTIADVLRWAVSRMQDAQVCIGHGTIDPWEEARRLVLPILHIQLHIPSEVFAARLTFSERQKLVASIIQRVKDRTPTAYITNKAWFASLEFYVDERTFIPRSPVAELIEKKFTPWLTNSPKRILDVCTGCGCIAIACAYAFEEAEIDALDISKQALEVAVKNINNHELTDRVFPIESDLMSAVAGHTYDMIITNPPYVDGQDMGDLPKEYSYEPNLALAAGADGLDFIKNILATAFGQLNDGGILIAEVGNSMIALQEQFPEVNFTWVVLKNGGEGVFVLTKEQLAPLYVQEQLAKQEQLIPLCAQEQLAKADGGQ